MSVDKVQLLNEAILLLERQHYLGAQLEDPYVTDGACDVCMHVMNNTQPETHWNLVAVCFVVYICVYMCNVVTITIE